MKNIDKIWNSISFSEEKKTKIETAISLLSIRERAVLEMRFGLKDGITHSLAEVGKEFGVTRERVRQVEAKILEKIKECEEIFT